MKTLNLINIVEQVAKAFVRHAQDVEVREVQGGRFIHVKVNRSDMALLIGSKGRNSRALQELVGLLSEYPRQTCRVVIDEPTVGSIEPHQDFRVVENWDSEPIRAIAESVIELAAEGHGRVAIHDNPTGGTSLITLVFTGRVQQSVVDRVAPPLQTIIESAGKRLGRVLSVGVRKELAAERVSA